MVFGALSTTRIIFFVGWVGDWLIRYRELRRLKVPEGSASAAIFNPKGGWRLASRKRCIAPSPKLASVVGDCFPWKSWRVLNTARRGSTARVEMILLTENQRARAAFLINALADAGCPVIQMEEPQIHMVPARGKPFGRIEIPELVKIFNNTVKGLRGKTEVWCHTCWGNPAQQRIFRDVQSYQPTLEALNQVDADALTFETCSSGTGDLEAIGRTVTDKKVVIGVIDHHTLQIERPDQVAEIIREALKHIPPERMVISSDCGMGREGMSRRHAQYKMVAMVLGTNIVRKEMGLPEAECLAADPRYSLAL